MVRPSQRREVAKHVAGQGMLSIQKSCELFYISETCFRYKPKCDAENQIIADWLIRLSYIHLPKLGLWFMFFVFAECERLFLESQACVSRLPRAGA